MNTFTATMSACNTTLTRQQGTPDSIYQELLNHYRSYNPLVCPYGDFDVDFDHGPLDQKFYEIHDIFLQ